MKERRFKNPEYVYVNINKDNFIFIGIRPKGKKLTGFGFYPNSKTILQRIRIFINKYNKEEKSLMCEKK